jgi:hypothetical protein
VLPDSKILMFFQNMKYVGFRPSTERVGRPGVSDGPLLPAPPQGMEIALLIHLDHYYDGSPSDSASSGVSRLPSSSSGLLGRPFPFYMNFSWLPGVMDGHYGARAPRGGGHASSRLADSPIRAAGMWYVSPHRMDFYK